ncbi:MAG: hypothetical protein HC819_19240 [Cyclobacteriaceae bacterium]|nr:hypothetical protein [Cyclobacteriaceae bacterium]
MALIAFISFSPLVFEKFKTYNAIISNSKQMDINNAALFYTEEAHSLMAEKKLKEQLQHIKND